MIRTVSADLSLSTSPGAAQLALMVAVAQAPGLTIRDSLSVMLDGTPIEPTPVEAPHGSLIHLIELPPQTQGGSTVLVRYDASVTDGPEQSPEPTSRHELLGYLRPSRYAESDRLLGTAQSEFAGLAGTELLPAVASWVGQQLDYVPGASRPTDGAVETLLARAGVCRDFAHVVVALLRALEIPARLTAVYAPGLHPMDFHAVAEAWVEGGWHVVDATLLAPRSTLLRISTGRDAADTAFLSSYGAPITLGHVEVTATSDSPLPPDDLDELVRIR